MLRTQRQFVIMTKNC